MTAPPNPLLPEPPGVDAMTPDTLDEKSPRLSANCPGANPWPPTYQ
jgi:hypothetical protein